MLLTCSCQLSLLPSRRERRTERRTFRINSVSIARELIPCQICCVIGMHSIAAHLHNVGTKYSDRYSILLDLLNNLRQNYLKYI